MTNCPYDFMHQHEDWFYWHKCILFDKLTPEQATNNVKFKKNGWKLLDGMKYGGWTPDRENSSWRKD
mgnify:CR=1 FL=1|jgi:hypothetical protein